MFATTAVLTAAWALRPHAVRSLPTPSTPARTATTTGHAGRRTARRAAEIAYPDALELIVLAVRAGHLPASALHAVTPHVPPSLRPAFAEVSRRARAGERFADALAALPELLGPMAAPLADSFAAADRYGLPLAPVLERLADEARQRRRRRADTLARQLPVRMSLPLVVCTLPSFMFLAVVPLLLAALSSLRR